MKTFIKQTIILALLLISVSASAQYFSDFSNTFAMDTKIPSVSNWCPGPGVYYLPGQEIYLDYSLWENNLTSVELGFSSEENGDMQILQVLPPSGPVYITLPDAPTSFARLYIVARDNFGHVNNYAIPWEGYFTLGAATQLVDVPQGWSGISSAYVPENTDLSFMFAANMGDVNLVQDLHNIFWPAGGIFTLNEWNVFQGYFINAANAFTAEIHGSTPECDQWGNVPEGWGLIPIVADCDLDAENFFWWNLWSSVIIKEAAGWRVFWPDYNVKTLEILERGKSYLVYSTMANNDFVYSPCWEGETDQAKQRAETPESWNIPQNSPMSHVIAIPEEILNSSSYDANTHIGAFNNLGLCTGIASLGDLSITIFGDDPTTHKIEGMLPDEAIGFRLWNRGNEIPIRVEFNPILDQDDGVFVPNGMSVISEIKVGSSGLNNHVLNDMLIHPNPAQTIVQIKVPDQGIYQLEIVDAKGSLILRSEISGQLYLNIQNYKSGLYLVRVFNNDKVWVEKLRIE